jgi:hypothetical protein
MRVPGEGSLWAAVPLNLKIDRLLIRGYWCFISWCRLHDQKRYLSHSLHRPLIEFTCLSARKHNCWLFVVGTCRPYLKVTLSCIWIQLLLYFLRVYALQGICNNRIVTLIVHTLLADRQLSLALIDISLFFSNFLLKVDFWASRGACRLVITIPLWLQCINRYQWAIYIILCRIEVLFNW